MRRLAISCLLVVWLAFDFPVVTGKVLFPVDWEPRPSDTSVEEIRQPANPLEGDAYTFYYPLRLHLGERFRAGELPLWDPHRFAGLPFAANSQAAVWYPPSWLFALGETTVVYSWILVLSRLGGLLLAYWFFRLLRLHPLASAAGAVIFMFSGFFTGWGVHITFVSAGIWLPLVLGGLTMIFQGRHRFGVPAAAAGLGLSALAGHPQVTIYVWLAAALWVAVLSVGVVVDRRREGEAALGGALVAIAIPAVVAFVLGGGLATIQLLGSLEFGSDIIRGVEIYDLLIASALPARQVLALLIPDRFGNPIDGNGLEPPNYTEAAMYVGIFTLVLVVVTVWSRRDRFAWGFIVIGVISLLSAIGTGFYRVLYEVVPGLDRVRAPGRIVFLLDAALAGLAAIGADQLIRRPRRWPVALASLALLLGVFLSVTVLNRGAIDPGYLLPRVVMAGLLVMGGAAVCLLGWKGARRPVLIGLPLLALITLDLWLFGFRYHPFQRQDELYRTDAAIDYLESSTRPRPRFVRLNRYWIQVNGALVHDLYDVQGYDALIPRRYVDLISLAEDQHENAQAFNVVYNLSDPSLAADPVLDLLGVGFVLGKDGTDGLGPPLAGDSYAVFEQQGALPPAFLLHCWTWVAEGTAIDRLAGMETAQLRATAVLESPSGQAPPPDRSTRCEPGSEATVETYEPERVVLSVDAEREAVLVLTDTWDPGWRATVDGHAVTILRANHALRAVRLDPGEHRVVFSFEPSWLLPGAIVSISSLAVMVLWAVVPRRWLSRRVRAAFRPGRA
ncbi:MAG: YfhO family protein [Actinomycetota bacterium]